MKALYVRRLYLWPRFQAQAREDLEARPPQVGGGQTREGGGCLAGRVVRIARIGVMSRHPLRPAPLPCLPPSCLICPPLASLPRPTRPSTCPCMSPPQLLELAQPMSAAMSLIYESIAELMGECVRELKRINNKLDATDLTVNQVRCAALWRVRVAVGYAACIRNAHKGAHAAGSAPGCLSEPPLHSPPPPLPRRA